MSEWIRVLCCGILALLPPAAKEGYFVATYPPSAEAGRLKLGVTYTLWVPRGVEKLRGVIVHQHGCGAGACKGGETAAYDLHWQALARKWDCALLGPSYQQDDKQDCRLWCDPKNGSRDSFLRALADLAASSGHPELEKVPWCLWGHSGGGTWASLMLSLFPERVVAVWLRSGTAFHFRENAPTEAPSLSDAVYRVPVMCNPGMKEKGDKRFDGAWTGTLAMFKAFRAKGAPIGFAPDPRTSHECGDSRYLAIRYFDACMSLRLPEGKTPGEALRSIDGRSAWLAEALSDQSSPAASYSGKVEESVWLPTEAVARAWEEYVRTGAVGDATPPPAPENLEATSKADGSVELRWDAKADLESGLRAFLVERDGQELAQVPEKPVGRYGRPLFQSMSFHDTPEAPLPELRYVDRTAGAGEKRVYRIRSVNGTGLKSDYSPPASLQ